MRTYLFGLFVLLAAPSFAQQRPPDIPFDSVADFLKLPAGMNFGEVSGVAVNSRGHVFVFTRSNSAGGPAYAPTASQLLEFGPKGEFIREIGKGNYGWSFAHTVRIDKDDNIWAVDKGSDMVIKFNQAGRIVMVFGRRKESADEDTGPWEHPDPPLPHVDGLFRQPTDVAWDSEGNTYITDGYVNSRVAKYDKNGDWVKSWGEKGTGQGQFRTPHAIAVDRNNNNYVGDRANRRIQVFDTDGKFLRMFTIDVPPDPGTRPVNGNTPTGAALAATIGAPNSVCITPGPNQVMFVGESTFPGRLFKVSLDGKVLGVIGRSGRQLKQFSGVHQLACPSETEVYAAETSNWRVQKLLLRSPRQSTSASPAQNAEIHVISSNGIKAAMEKILPAYEHVSGQHVTIEWGASAVLKRTIEDGKAFDLAILTPAVIDDLIKTGQIAAGTHTDVARIDLAVGMRAGAPRIDISTADALKRRILAAKSITYAKEGAATPTFNSVLKRLGIADAVQSKIVLQTVSGRQAQSVGEGENELVFAPLSEIQGVHGVEVLGLFPAEFQNPIVMAAAIGAQSKKSDASRALIQFLTSAKAASMIKSSGMEPVARK